MENPRLLTIIINEIRNPVYTCIWRHVSVCMICALIVSPLVKSVQSIQVVHSLVVRSMGWKQAANTCQICGCIHGTYITHQVAREYDLVPVMPNLGNVHLVWIGEGGGMAVGGNKECAKNENEIGDQKTRAPGWVGRIQVT